MRFRDIIKIFPHLRYVFDEMVFSTNAGKERMLNTLFLNDVDMLEAQYGRLDDMLHRDYEPLKVVMSHFRDVRGTINRLADKKVLTELELFELKYFTYYVNKLAEQKVIKLNSLSSVFDILDPNASGVVNFYIYESYSSELAELRAKLPHAAEGEETEALFSQIARCELEVRERLSDMLYVFHSEIVQVYNAVAENDMLIAQCDLIKKFSLSQPSINSEYKGSSFKSIFNPYIMSLVPSYQCVDVSLTCAPTLITGANMSGKTMLLKTLALAQYMVQFGMYAPAERAELSLVDDVFLAVGDEQNEKEGLSSYAAEIVRVSSLIDSVVRGEKLLVLIDELARTTSPYEGAAIVDATISILAESGVISLIATHFDSLVSEVRRLRVRGFTEGKSDKKITKQNIASFIDYTLYEQTKDESKSSSEAIRIAEILGVNEKLINKTKEFVCTKKVN